MEPRNDLVRRWLWIVGLSLLCLPFQAAGEPHWGINATSQLELPQRLHVEQRGNAVLFNVRLSQQNRIIGSVSYSRGNARLRANIGYLARTGVRPGTIPGVNLPLYWGVRSRIEMGVWGMTSRDWLGLQVPLGAALKLPRNRLQLLLEIAPGLNMASMRPVLELESWMKLNARF